MKVLVVVDMQNDFITGSLGSERTQAVVPAVIKKIKEHKEMGSAIFYTRDTHYEDYLNSNEGKKLPVEHCIIETEGWELIPEVKELVSENELVVNKTTFGSLALPTIIQEVVHYGRQEELEEIELIGVCTDICVVSNAMIIKATYAGYPGMEVSICKEACAGTSLEAEEATYKVLESCQINVK